MFSQLELPPSITTTSRKDPLTIQFTVQWSLMERGHPVRLSAKREHHLENIRRRGACCAPWRTKMSALLQGDCGGFITIETYQRQSNPRCLRASRANGSAALRLSPKSRVISPQSGRMTIAQQFTAGDRGARIGSP